MKNLKKVIYFILIIFLGFGFISCSNSKDYEIFSTDELKVEEEKYYFSHEDVSKYIHEFKKLPNNYITKDKAYDLGWNPEEGNLWDIKFQAVIGGDEFKNFEEKLPSGKYNEADVDYYGGFRNSNRLVYDKNGNIYFSDDHYESFEKLY
ncbi:MAG: ribonuclease domain-containing protein [Peptoniphilaceae bacterium]|nr:ribonuclease [Peptoniphilaceae bacterium]MDD7383165.1 ribonuclease domain-containing protein [Peptoniphilaceae bacterium]MDY3738389.1 ribonuclease domain-containing protein [Peptoniphilaceae bacterium]